MKLVFTLIIYLIILFCTNCNQCETTQCTDGNTEDKISNVIKKYFYFKVGTWWVYENEISFERDSIYVVEGKYEKFFISEACKCDERIYVRSGTSVDDSLIYTSNCLGDPNVFFVRKKSGSSFKELTYRFIEQDDTSLKLENQHNGIITFLPSYKGINEEFKEVYRCFYHKALTDYLSDSYFAPNIGLIRFRYKEGDGSYWDLVKYHVNK